MCLDWERDDESIPPDEGEEWINDVWDLSSDTVAKVRRSMEEILELEYQLIDENTEFPAALWISIYAKRFREIMEEDSSLTKFQVKYKLYVESIYKNGLHGHSSQMERKESGEL